jgi:hypothetical protein
MLLGTGCVFLLRRQAARAAARPVAGSRVGVWGTVLWCGGLVRGGSPALARGRLHGAATLGRTGISTGDG